MVSVISIREAPGCLDESLQKDFVLDGPLTEELMRRMSEGGTLKFYPHFPRPYFRIDRRGAFVVQGVLGNQCFRVTLSRNNTAVAKRILVDLIEDGRDGCKATKVL